MKNKNLKRFTGIFFTLFILLAVYFFHFTLNLGKNNLDSKSSLAFELIDMTTQVGINHTHETDHIHPQFANVAPWFKGMGASVAVVDPDDSGWYDIYLTTQKIGGLNHYYKNNRDGTFKEMAQELHISDVNNPYPGYRAIFVDLDNDGLKDLILLSFKSRVFHNTGKNGYSEIDNHGIDAGIYYGGANLVELNNSGRLELILSPYLYADLYYKPQTTLVNPDNFFEAKNGSPKKFYRNLGNGKFDSPPHFLDDLQHIGWGHSVGVFDIRGTGKKDIWFPEDFGMEKVFFNSDNKNFKAVGDRLLQRTYGFGRNGMNVEIADVDNDNHPLVFVSHVYEKQQKVAGNNLWKWKKGDQFENLASTRGVQDCGWAWGAKFIDFDNSSYLDLIVMNGFISANPKKSYWYSLSVLDSAGAFLIRDSKNWPGMKDSSLSGFQKSCLFLNDKKGKFVDVADKTPLLNQLQDKRGVATIDFKNTGSPSLIIANQNGKAVFLETIQKNKNQWIGFKFRGTKSNRDGWGAKVVIEFKDKINDKRLTRELEPLNSYSAQSEDRLLIGLGERPLIKSIAIEWPSGIKQYITQFHLNQYNLVVENDVPLSSKHLTTEAFFSGQNGVLNHFKREEICQKVGHLFKIFCFEGYAKEYYLQNPNLADWSKEFSTHEMINYLGLGIGLAQNIQTPKELVEVLHQQMNLNEDEVLSVIDGWSFGRLINLLSSLSESAQECLAFRSQIKTDACLFGVGRGAYFLGSSVLNVQEIKMIKNGSDTILKGLGFATRLGGKEINISETNKAFVAGVNLAIKNEPVFCQRYVLKCE